MSDQSMPTNPVVLSQTVSQIGEVGLLKIVQSYCAADLVGDDAALLTWAPGQLTATTDALVDGVHFSDVTTPPHAVGWRAAAANLSDLAAMGADPVALLISLGVPGSTPVTWIRELYEGIVSCGRPWQVEIVGGDLCRSAQRFVAITALGRVTPGEGIRRRTAQPGDWLVVTGVHGSSRAGLEILLNPQRQTGLDLQAQNRLIRAHQYPQPRLDVVAVIRELGIPRVSGMDTSDGLADALLQVCRMSGVMAVVDPGEIPMDPALQQGFPEQALEWALYGGEDFELLLSLPADAADALVKRVPTAAIIGQVQAGSGLGVELKGLGSLDAQRTFQHFGVETDPRQDPDSVI